MKVDIFTREQMARAYEQTLGVPTFLYSTLWGNSQSQKIVTADVKVMVDKINKSRYLAGYTEHQEPARIISKDGYGTDEYQPPFINESVAFNYTHASKRPAGVTPFGTHGLRTGVDELMRNARELKNRWMRTVEHQCASALFTGSITAGDKVFDFGLKTTHKKELTTKWTSDTADPFKDLDDIIALNEGESGTPTNMVIMSIGAYFSEAMAANTSHRDEQESYERQSQLIEGITGTIATLKDELGGLSGWTKFWTQADEKLEREIGKYERLLSAISSFDGLSEDEVASLAKDYGISIPGAARGADFVTSGPGFLAVGDNPGGKEHVQITPLSSYNAYGPSSSTGKSTEVHIHITGDVYGVDDLYARLDAAGKRLRKLGRISA